MGHGGDDHIEGGWGDDLISGGEGFDYASYSQSLTPVFVNLGITWEQQTGDSTGWDEIVGVEGLIGSDHNDELTGNDEHNILVGGTGADLLDGAKGSDAVSYAKAGGRVWAQLGDRGAELTTTLGGDAASGAASITVADASALVQGEAIGIEMDSGAMHWTTIESVTDAVVTLGDALTEAASAGAGLFYGVDTLVAVESLTGSDHDDILIGDGSANVLSGGDGSDRLYGGDGDDVLRGGG